MSFGMMVVQVMAFRSSQSESVPMHGGRLCVLISPDGERCQIISSNSRVWNPARVIALQRQGSQRKWPRRPDIASYGQGIGGRQITPGGKVARKRGSTGFLCSALLSELSERAKPTRESGLANVRREGRSGIVGFVSPVADRD